MSLTTVVIFIAALDFKSKIPQKIERLALKKENQYTYPSSELEEEHQF